MSTVDLDKLERLARAADKDNPGVCYQADHVDGYPTAESAMELHNEVDPATTLSLVRRIHELEDALRMQQGPTRPWTQIKPEEEYLFDIGAILNKGTTQYGHVPTSCDDRWDIDRPAES